MPLSLVYLEIVIRTLAGNVNNTGNIIAMVLVSLACGTILNLLASLTKRPRLNAWIAWLLLEIITVIFMISFFVEDSYQNYVNIATVFEGAGGIVKEFGSSIIAIITRRYMTILLFEIPAILLLFLSPIFHVLKFKRNKPRAYAVLLIVFAVLEAAGIGLSLRTQNNRVKLMAEYEFNTVVRCFNLGTGLKLDLAYMAFGNPYSGAFLEEAAKEPSSDAAKYGTNSLDLDFAALAADETDPKVKSVHEYINSISPSAKNEYTGLFEGKNLIFISVEAMSKEMIREDTMPTLYHMMTKGIVFEDYYQPYWNGSTATGEYTNLLGLIPTKAMASYEGTIGKNLYFSMGNELMRKGYYSLAFHNGNWDYYDRYLIHPNLGYEKFYAVGTGMGEALSGSYPVSDLEMMQYAAPMFADHAPFNMYFMTVAGHFPYFVKNNVMLEKYQDRTAHIGYSDIVDAYICSEIDYEESIRYLVEELKKAGTLEDTVFVMAPDHFPYGLTESDAWLTDQDYLSELYGYTPSNLAERDHNALIIWSPMLEEMDPITVSEPVYSVDILPTLLNLFGIEFDSRMFAGRDCLSDTEGLVIWPDYSWRTEKGTYLVLENEFIPSPDASFESAEEEKAYIEQIKTIVRNKMTLSTNILDLDYYNVLYPR